jgi:hypothetical protein
MRPLDPLDPLVPPLVVPPLVELELPPQGVAQNSSSQLTKVLSEACAFGCAAMQSLVHCWFVQGTAHVKTALHSASFAHWSVCEQHCDLRHDVHTSSPAAALQDLGTTVVVVPPPVLPLVPLVPPPPPPLPLPKSPVPLPPDGLVPVPVAVLLHATAPATQTKIATPDLTDMTDVTGVTDLLRLWLCIGDPFL